MQKNYSIVSWNVIFLSSFFLVSCCHVSYRSAGHSSLEVYNRSGNYTRFSIVGQRDFYLWGHYPKEAIVYLDKEIEDTTGLVALAHLEIEDFQSFKNIVLSYLTLGFYIPRNFRIKGVGRRPGFDYRESYDF